MILLFTILPPGFQLLTTGFTRIYTLKVPADPSTVLGGMVTSGLTSPFLPEPLLKILFI